MGYSCTRGAACGFSAFWGGHGPVRQVECQLLHNQEDEKRPKYCLRLGDRHLAHVDSEIDRCADEGDQRPFADKNELHSVVVE